LLVVVALGLLLGLQILEPHRRVIQAAAGLAMIILVWRFPLFVGLSLLILVIPFPTRMSFGSTNAVFTFLIFLSWRVKAMMAGETGAGRTPIDTPIMVMVLVYLVSFYNIPGMYQLKQGLVNFEEFIAWVALFYIVVNFIKTENDLRRIVMVQSVTCILVLLVAIYEIVFPGRPLVVGWLPLIGGKSGIWEFVQMRVGGPFADFELLAEYTALNVPLQFLMLLRARSQPGRLFWGILIIVTLTILLATATRGAFIALWIGMAYLFILARRALGFRNMVIVSVTAIMIFLIAAAFVQTQTGVASMYERLMKTTFVGYMPDTRSDSWSEAFQRGLENPIFGHGPYFTLRAGVRRFFWPHNVYLFYFYILGLTGVTCFVWILVNLLRTSFRHMGRALTNIPFSKSLLLILHVMLIIFAIDQLKIEYLRNTAYPFIVWFLFGLTVACSRIAAASDREVQSASRPSD
jgi:hypothetical protein